MEAWRGYALMVGWLEVSVVTGKAINTEYLRRHT
jgi:hypothetical protein